MKRIIICIGFIGFIPAFCKSQACKDNFLGSKTLYFSQQQKNSTVPNGYHTVFINHVGRHGSRHVTKDVNSAYLYRLLAQADSMHQLSAAGLVLKEKITRLEKIEKNNFKSISIQGKKEQGGLAERMYTQYPDVFTNTKPVIDVAYTKEIRTLQTSDAFLAELKTKITDPVIKRHINDTTLRFYDLSPAYLEFKENGNWIQYLQQLKAAVRYDELADKVTRQFFSTSFLHTITAKDKDKFTADLFGFITILYSLQKETADAGYTNADVNMEQFLTCPELAVLAKVDNAEDFLQKGPGTNAGGIQVKIAMPLLADFIQSTDTYIKTKTVPVRLRFAHAETIAPFAALLGLSHATEATKKVKDIDQLWDAGKVIPLSSNIQWILYKKQDSETYLVKFLFNEKEVGIKGLTTKTFPYYNWSDVRAYYIKKMQRFNAGPDTDYTRFLKDLQ